MPAHTPANKRIIEFVLMQDNNELDHNGEPKGLFLPIAAQFEDIIAEAMSKTVDINMDWCNVIARRFVTRFGICVVALSYGYAEGADIFRSQVTSLSTNKVSYDTYPAADMR